MLEVAITAVVTFALTALWQSLATRRIRNIQRLMAGAIVDELEEMARDLGHADLPDYYRKKRGEDYALKAMANLHNFIQSFSDRGSDNIREITIEEWNNS